MYVMALTAVLDLVTENDVRVVVPYTGDNDLIFRKIASYEFTDGAGSSVIGGSGVKSDYSLLVKGARKAQSRSLAANSLSWASSLSRWATAKPTWKWGS